MPLNTKKLVVKAQKLTSAGSSLREAVRKSSSTLPVASTLSAGILIGTLSASAVHGQERPSDSPAPLAIPQATSLSTPFSKIAKEVGPAVVNINIEILPETARSRTGRKGDPRSGQDGNGDQDGDQQGNESQSPDNMQDFFNRFFGGVPGGSPNGGRQSQQAERALGSGFIVDPHGYIVTADHVIDKADRIYVKLTTDPANDQGHPARVIGVDKETDLAVIKIDDGSSLPTVKLGNAESAEAGDWGEAIGSPFDLAQTVTTGIVSAKNRNLDGEIGGQFKHFIQTDAAINQGNSGGPLLNMAGEVIGINDALLTQTNGYMGIGFAIPSNTAIEVYNQLVGPEHKVVRGSIGISFQPSIDTAVAKMYGASNGVLISSVTPGKAAERAGLKADDVIVAVDGKPVKNGDALIENIAPRKPGSTVTLAYLRDGQKRTTACTIDDRADLVNVARVTDDSSAPGAPEANPSKAKLGLTVTDLPDHAPGGLHGVLIQSVTPGSFADDLNPQVGPGVVIEEVNRTPVRSKAEFNTLVASIRPGSDVVLGIVYPNSGGQITLTGNVLP